MPRILKNLRIDEVSAVMKSAGVGTKVVIMKRDTSGDDDFDEWHREQAAIAERMNEEHLREDAEREERDERVRSAARKRFTENWNKAFALDAGDETVSAGNDHHASKVADLLVESGSHNTREDALAYLLHHKDGAALLRRLHKSEDTPNMATPEQKLSDLVKRAGITAVAAQIVKADSAFSIDEHELTKLTIEHAKREHPQLTDAQAFAKVYSAQDEGGIILRKAFSVVRSATPAADVHSEAAYRELQAIGKRDSPELSSHQQFAKAFEAHPELATRAHRRPSAGSTFPFPKF